ncbi:MAG: helix-turn-helix domain-containing protein [Parcubacteria group bacterium]|nr:helix-turn-helix domain-containing protein [Parcubacteria group bacterium]
MDQIQLSDRNYISAKRGAEITGYTQDYIGQLCRGGKIPAKRIGSNWYLSESDLMNYKSGKAPKKGLVNNETNDSSFVEDGFKYVSSKVASEITGYSQDYIGQLARNGKIKSKQVGRQWYVAQNELVWHQESTSAYNVGFNKDDSHKPKIGDVVDLRYKETPKIIYREDDRPLKPELKKQRREDLVLNEVLKADEEDEKQVQQPLVRTTAVVQRAALALQTRQTLVPSTVARVLSLGVIVAVMFFGSIAISTIEGHVSYSRVGDRIVLDGKRIALTDSLVAISASGGHYTAAAVGTITATVDLLRGIVK